MDPGSGLAVGRTRWLFCAVRFGDNLMLVYPVYVLLFLRAGLSLLEISWLFAIWCGSVVLTEVPTGALADRHDRRNLLVMAALSKTVGFACWGFASSFWLFALGFLFWGLSESLASGTLQSLLWDRLAAVGEQERYLEVVSRGGVFSNIGTGIACVAGGLLAAHSIPAALWSSVFCMVPVISLVLLFRDPRPQPLRAVPELLVQTILKAAGDVVAQRDLGRLMLYSMLGLVWANLEEYDQAYRDFIGMPVWVFGVWSVVLMLVQAAGAAWAACLGGRPTAKYVCTCVSGACLAAAAYYPSFYLLPVCAVSFGVMATAEVLVDHELQNAIGGQNRATVTSIHSL
ncbi:MFS transporter, partial [Myxococcota bacterium]